MSIWRKRKLKTYEDLPELRRQAFVDCIMRKSSCDDIVGIFGTKVNEPLIYAYGLYTVPIEGLDGYVFKYGDYPGCDLIRSTIIYLKTEKCPLQFSAKMYVMDNFCNKIISALKHESNKVIHVYENEEALKAQLEKEYKKEYSDEKYIWAKEQFKKIDEILTKLSDSDLTGKELFLIEFFSRYLIDLDERVEFLEETLQKVKYSDSEQRELIPAWCTGGIYESIECYSKSKRYRIVNTNEPKFTCKNCFVGNIKLSYVGGNTNGR